MAKDCEQILFVTYSKGDVHQIQCSGLVPGPGHVYCTLIIGSEKCLLIDNGFGDDDFTDWPPELVDQMKGKELICVATHAHPDHIGGAEQFDSLYIHPADYPLLVDGQGLAWEFQESFDNENMRIGKCQILPLEDGQVFDLGDRKITAIATPGHTLGGVCFYDDKDRIMMTGDTLNRHVFLFGGKLVTFQKYAESLKKLLEYDFDEFLGGHHPDPFKREWIGKMIDLVEGFQIEKAKPYIRDGHFSNMLMVSEGRGYGDPNYIAYIFMKDQLEAYLR